MAKFKLGGGTLVASDVLIASENHSIDPLADKYYKDQELVSKAVTIGSGCWIGEKAVILPGVTIGDKCVIGAGSIVTKDVPDFCMAVGNPAKVIKKFDKEKRSWVPITK